MPPASILDIGLAVGGRESSRADVFGQAQDNPKHEPGLFIQLCSESNAVSKIHPPAFHKSKRKPPMKTPANYYLVSSFPRCISKKSTIKNVSFSRSDRGIPIRLRLRPTILVLCFLGALAHLLPSTAIAQATIDRADLINMDAETAITYSGIFHNRRTRVSKLNVAVTNTSSNTMSPPVILVIESISEPTVTLANADGTLTPDGAPYVDLTGQVPGDDFEAGEQTNPRPLEFNNPTRRSFTIQASVFQQNVSATSPAITLEIPSDANGRRLIGIPDGVTMTVRATGTDPVEVDLGQTPATPGSRGTLFFGSSGNATAATVTTSGGADNTAQIQLRGDPDRPSAFHGDVNLTASVGGTEVASEYVTVIKILIDRTGITFMNDRSQTLTLSTIPATDDVEFTVTTFRRHPGNMGASAISKTDNGIRIVPLDGAPSLTTDADGRTQFQVQNTFKGQGWNLHQFAAPNCGAATGASEDSTEPCKPGPCDSGCGGGSNPGDDDGGGGSNFGDDDKKAISNSVRIYSGEKVLSITDLTIPGRGFDYRFSRAYRSQASHLRSITPDDFGVDWVMSYSGDMLLEDGNNVIACRDNLRTDPFIATTTPGVFVPPVEYYEELRLNGDGDYELRSADGQVKTYKGFTDPDIPGRLISIEDRNGNIMRFIYTQPAGLSKFVLTTVVDTLGRNIIYRYYDDSETNVGRRGRLQEIEDFRRDNSPSGRQLTFDYDDEGNLISVTRPAVQGTPNGNDFPAGKTTEYTYTQEADIPASVTGIDRERLLHNLISIQYPNETALDPGNPRVSLTYGTDPSNTATFDRVLTYTIGGTNLSGVPAGGTITYDYEFTGTPFTFVNSAFLEITVTDRRGNVTEYAYSAWDTLLEKRELTRGFRTTEPAAFTTQNRYNSDKELIKTILPQGNTRDYTFDQANADRFQNGNITNQIRARDDARGGDQTALFTNTVYEPIYQQPAVVIDSRGIDTDFVPPIPDLSGRTQAERYTTRYFFDYQEADAALVLPLLAAELNTSEAEVQSRLDVAGIQLGLGDLNDDGDTSPCIAGNVIRKEEPPVVLLASSNQAAIEGDQLQDIITLYRYNPFGQKTSTVDPEGNVHTYTYFSETDPDGDGNLSAAPADGRTLNATTGGYLAEEITDTASDPIRNNGTNPTPVNIAMAYTYDDVGNQTSMTDGRGIRTDYVVNELNQVVRTIRAADVSGTASVDPVEPLALTAFAYIENVFYDFNDNIIRREVEDRGDTSNTGGFIDKTIDYDILDNRIQMTQEVDITETLVTQYRYDANENQTLVIQPEGNATTSLYDERDLLFQTTPGALNATAETLGAPSGPYDPRGGVPSTTTYNYDSNQNLIETVDADDTDNASGNNSTIAGDGDAMLYVYDGFDRRVATIDAVGNESFVTYDPVNNITSETRRGPIGGASPTDNLGANNVDLSITEYQYDERNRRIQEDRVLFVSPGVVTERTPSITDGAQTPGDDRVTIRMEYDRKSRQTFLVQDDLDTYQTEYDGANRVIKTMDPEGNIVQRAYDDNHNVIEVKETDISQIAGVADEAFLTTFFYDSLNRRQQQVDNIGQTLFFRYDSRNNQVARADAQGPLTGSSIIRRAFANGALTVNTINDFGNVTVYEYDGINRKTREDVVLTASGEGDGVTIGVDLFGVKMGTPTPDTSQSGDGLITVRYDWDQNSLLTNLTDDNGNQTQYTYDNLNRKLTETRGISVAPGLADRDDPDTTITYEFDQDHNIIQTTDENGSIIAYTFDAINRQTACSINRAPGVIGTAAMTHEYDGLSRSTGLTDNNDPIDASDDSVITYVYDSLSRIIEETQQIGSLPAKAISSGWNAENLRTGLTYPNGRSLDYTYDGLDRLDTIADQGVAQPIVDYDYIGANRVLEREYPLNGTRLTYLNDDGDTDVGYDGLRRPIQHRNVRSDNTILVGFTHSYDRMNNKLNEDKLHDPINNEDYAYDSAYRLIDFDRPMMDAMTPLHSQWTLDGVGNWQQVNAEVREHSSFNELIDRDGTTLDHDDNGNQIDDGTFTFEWDYLDRLRSVTRKADGMVVAVYSYDAKWRRTRKVVTNSSTLDGQTDYYYDGWRVVEERDGADNLGQQYVWCLFERTAGDGYEPGWE